MSREERLKAALRDNLKRRKVQARGRARTAEDGAETPQPAGSAASPPPSKACDGSQD